VVYLRHQERRVRFETRTDTGQVQGHKYNSKQYGFHSTYQASTCRTASSPAPIIHEPLSSEFGSNILFFDILICIMILRWSSVFMDANKSNQIKGERFAPWGK
jgi:hypothetical protein